jgi:hypothetical protein
MTEQRSPDPTSIVQRQLDAYNQRDLDAFMALFAAEACGYELGSPTPTMNGKAEIRARYQQLFANSPHLHSRVVTRVAIGRTVVDLESITGRNGSPDVVNLMVIYQVADGLIQRFHVARDGE